MLAAIGKEKRAPSKRHTCTIVWVIIHLILSFTSRLLVVVLVNIRQEVGIDRCEPWSRAMLLT